MKELLVRTKNRAALETLLKKLGGTVEEDPDPGYGQDVYVVRSLGPKIGFLRFAIENQGHGEIVAEREG